MNGHRMGTLVLLAFAILLSGCPSHDNPRGIQGFWSHDTDGTVSLSITLSTLESGSWEHRRYDKSSGHYTMVGKGVIQRIAPTQWRLTYESGSNVYLIDFPNDRTRELVFQGEVYKRAVR